MLVLTKVDLDSVLAHYDDVAIQVKEVAERLYPTPSKTKWTFFQKVSQSVIKKKLELEKNSDLPFLIVDVKNLPNVTILLFSVFALVYN